MKKKQNEYVLLHAHAYAGPKGRRSYLRFGKAMKKETLKKEAKARRLDGYRIVPKSSICKTKHKRLWYVKK